ncbi:MAG: 2-amino-4-hydroxy-6-hydroxymethyldihydropteridine diphosphokinase [Luteitalea sp.]|nr:2-amino-4-hydroxy-6-hydroxymethyldihydropteridine diphosphokinase [Luteitalea sp.]
MRLSRVAIALGSNLGDRRAHLEYARARLPEHLSHLTASSVHETKAVGDEPQPDFLNSAVVGVTALGPRELLGFLLQVEQERGRSRPDKTTPQAMAGAAPHSYAPRTLDLDLILFGSYIVEEPGLHVPHARFRERLFVLDPLSEIASDWLDPITGMTVAELRARLHAHGKARGQIRSAF